MAASGAVEKGFRIGWSPPLGKCSEDRFLNPHREESVQGYDKIKEILLASQSGGSATGEPTVGRLASGKTRAPGGFRLKQE